MKAEKIAEVVEALARRGFKYSGRLESGWLQFTGFLKPDSSTHGCDVFVDVQFIELPLVRLHHIPESLPAAVEHLSSEGFLCYLTKGGVALDIFDPVGQTIAFLQRAEYVLGQVLKRELVADLEEEFFSYWGGLTGYIDIQENNLGIQQSLMVGEPTPNAIAVTDNLERTKLKLAAMGLKPAGDCVPAYRIRTMSKPRPSRGSWPPKNLGDILEWQQALDPNCRKKIEQRVDEAISAKHSAIIIIIQSPKLAYGFGVFFQGYELLRGKYKKRFNKRRFRVEPFSLHRIDEKYVAERNIPGHATLAGRNLVVVGCGTIGGYLADLLVKAGAGTAGGRLTLVDNDQLMPQNVGRHRLGFPHLLKNKAKALADELSKQMPDAALRALPVDVMEAHLGTFDLLIDATGEESLGHWLSKRYSPDGPLLSVWIEGPGVAVRSLLRNGAEGACPRCLSRHNRAGVFRSVKGEVPQIFAGQGCEGMYVPFPATVSLQAAALGADAVLAWVNGNSGPTLRTRLTDFQYELATPDCSPPPFEDCPACGS